MGGHWKNAESRWSYHKAAINIIKNLDIQDPLKVLEMGTMGIQLVKNSHSIDYTEKWNYKNKKSTFIHDARNIPWPIENKKYDLFIALRVFQHLFPHQRECFLEAKRIAKNMLLVIPESYNVESLRETSSGISRETIYQFNGGVPSNKTLEIRGFGVLYFFDKNSLS